MGYLKQFFRNVFRDEATGTIHSSFQHLSEEELETHLEVKQYGSFKLTDAVRPSYDLQVVPKQGFRRDTYRDEESKTNVPVIMGAATSERLFDTFLELLDPLGTAVDVVLETSHHHENREHVDLYREHIDMPVLKSILCDYEDMLLNDGCTGIAVLNPHAPMEIQFDEHKLLIVYGQELKEFESVLVNHDVFPHESIKFITEAEHVHSSSDQYYDQFEELKTRLGMDESY